MTTLTGSAGADHGSTIRAFGAVIVADQPLGRTMHAGTLQRTGRDVVAIYLSDNGPADVADADPSPAGLMVDVNHGRFADAAVGDGLMVVLPRRIVSAVISGPLAHRTLPASRALDAFVRLARALLRLEARLSEAQGRLAGKALTEMLAAAALPLGGAIGVGLRREATLLERVIEHVDGRLRDPVDVAALCQALHCSRSALYRATAATGGIVALVNQRRLAAVRDRLSDPDECASIAALAREHGFADAAGFNHSFRRNYGITPGQFRRGQRAGGMDDNGDRR